MNCLRQLARERGVPAYIAGDHWRTDASGRLDGPWGDWRDVRLSLAGPHQVENTGVALMALWVFEPALLADERRVRATLESISWPGRFELVAEHPRTWADGAHNVDSILRLIETIRHENASQPMVVIVGIARDKDAAGMLRALATLPAKLIVTASTNPRALTTRELSETAYSLGIAHETAPNVDDALARARELATPNGSVIATGSLHVVAELREALGLATTPVFERELLYG
jgi:dihydrofolate synthase/folylpolyglutamate synthase